MATQPMPWEKYSAPQESGPWQKYAAPAASASSNEQPGFFHSMLSQINPIPAIKDYFTKGPPLRQGLNAMAHGNPEELPEPAPTMTSIVGQPARTAGSQFSAGNVAGGLGTLAGGYGIPAAGATKIPVAAAEGAARHIPAAVAPLERMGEFIKAAGPDVAKGTAKAGVGLALAEAAPGPFKYPARAAAVWPGISQVRQGFKAGLAAASPEAMAAKDLEIIPTAGGGIDAGILEGIARGFGKSFDNMSPAEQATVRSVASRINKPAETSLPSPNNQPMEPGWWMDPLQKAQAAAKSATLPRAEAGASPPQATEVIPKATEQPSAGGPAFTKRLGEVRQQFVDKGLLPEARNLGELPKGNYVDRYDVGSGAPLMRGPQTKIVKPSTGLQQNPKALEAAQRLAKEMRNK